MSMSFPNGFYSFLVYSSRANAGWNSMHSQSGSISLMTDGAGDTQIALTVGGQTSSMVTVPWTSSLDNFGRITSNPSVTVNNTTYNFGNINAASLPNGGRLVLWGSVTVGGFSANFVALILPATGTTTGIPQATYNVKNQDDGTALGTLTVSSLGILFQPAGGGASSQATLNWPVITFSSVVSNFTGILYLESGLQVQPNGPPSVLQWGFGGLRLDNSGVPGGWITDTQGGD
jgi:hypothetical protein